jgi:hypothetical protein
MVRVTVTLVVATLLCLAFPTTRGIGVVGAALLVFLHPLLFTTIFVLIGVPYFIRWYTRRNVHELPRPNSRRN